MHKELLTEIKDALVKFGHKDLCEGAEVRDVLLDLLLLVQRDDPNAEVTSKGLVRPLETEKL